MQQKPTEEQKEALLGMKSYLAMPHPLDIINSPQKTPWSVSVAVILSGHCTDAAVNKVLPGFLTRFPDAESFVAQAPDKGSVVALLPGISHSGNKAGYIEGVARYLVDQGRNFENSLDKITEINGIGRKTGSIILHYCHGNTEGFPLDTHCLRVLERLGWFEAAKPKPLEKKLLESFSGIDRFNAHLILTMHGRTTCKAAKPDCANCQISRHCKFFSTNQSNQESKENKNP